MKIGLKARFSDLDEIVKLSPDFIEFQFSDKDPDYDFKPKSEFNIPCIIHLPEMWNGYLIDMSNIGNENQVLPLQKSVKIIQEMILKSEKFFIHFKNERNIFILHPCGQTFEKSSPKTNWHRMETLIKSLNQLRTNNSEILVENLPPFPWHYGGQWNSNFFMDMKEINEFCRITKRKICYDSSHSKLYCNAYGKDFFEQLNIIKNNIDHIHIGDASGVDGEGIQIDEGDIDFNRFFRELKWYKGTIVNEIWMGYLDDFAGFKIANKRIKKYLSHYS